MNYSLFLYHSFLNLLLLGSGEVRDTEIEDNAKDVSKEKVALPVGNSPVIRKELECSHHVLNNEGSAEHGNDAPGTPLATTRSKTGSELLAADTLTEGEDGNGEEEHVVSGVESMPEGAETVRGREASTGSEVYITGKPVGSLHVPHGTQSLDIGSGFEFHNPNIASGLPSLDLAVIIESLEASIPNVVGTLGILPGKVVFLANEKQSNPLVQITVNPRTGQELLGEDNWGGILRIGGVKKRELAGTDNEKTHGNDTDKEGTEGGPNLTGNLALGLAIGIIQETAVASVGVGLVLVSRTGQDGGKAKGITEVLNNAGDLVDGPRSALLGSTILLAVREKVSVVKVVGHAVKLDGDDHLRPSEIQIITQVVDVHAVQVTESHVRHEEDRNDSLGKLGGEDDKHGVADQRGDHLMNPLLANGELQEEGTEKEGKDMLDLAVGEHVHDDAQRVAREQTKGVVDGLGIETSSLGQTLHIVGNECGD